MKKEEVLKCLIHDMEKFLSEHKDLEFYALALDCYYLYSNFLVCMNTEKDFADTLKYYQKKYDTYSDKKYIRDLRYNPGDWEYTDISAIDLFDEDELTAKYQDDIDKQCDDMMLLCDEILNDFRKTDVFSCIPKTSDFVSFCIDHDEDVEEALKRYNIL